MGEKHIKALTHFEGIQTVGFRVGTPAKWVVPAKARGGASKGEAGSTSPGGGEDGEGGRMGAVLLGGGARSEARIVGEIVLLPTQGIVGRFCVMTNSLNDCGR